MGIFREMSIRRLLVHGGLSRDVFENVKPNIRKSNYRTLKWASAFGALVLVLLTIMSFVPYLSAFMGVRRYLYISYALYMTVISLSVTFIIKRDSRIVLPMMYLMLAGVYFFGIILGTVLNPQTAATTFCVMLFALPLLVVDRPYRVVILLMVSTVVFNIASYLTKDTNLFIADLVNSICFFTFGAVVGSFSMRTKLLEIRNRMHIELERDTDNLTTLTAKSPARQQMTDYLNIPGAQAVLVIIDVDNFKWANDKHGHIYGDTVLRIIGESIRASFRVDDILSRFGGDEFLAFLPDACERETIEERIRTLSDEIKSRVNEVHDIHITCSAGVAISPRDGEDLDTLIEKADEALYCSKRNGKNRYTFYSPDGNFECFELSTQYNPA